MTIMKLYKFLTLAAVAGAGMLAVSSCNDYDYDKEMSRAEILGPFSVTSPKGTPYNAVIDGDIINIKVNPFADVEGELSNALPTFFLPMGATCSPAPYEPQDFTQEVKYTVTSGDGKNTRTYTCNWVPSDQLEYGQGYSTANLLAMKSFTELGYPGTLFSYTEPSHLIGDLIMFPAFCEDNKLVGFSRMYAWGNTDENGAPAPAADLSLAFKVWDATTLELLNETVNLGSLAPGQIVNITNDSKGHMVAATGAVNSGESEVYYWTSLAAAPVKVGKLPVPVYFNSHSLDANLAIEVVGDITGDAAISYIAQRSATGEHNIVYVRGGQIASSKVISTGYPSNDASYFQMISLFSPDENSAYLIGDGEGTRDNGSIKGYYQTAAGLTVNDMFRYHNGVDFTDGVTCWSQTGVYGLRGGARRPHMMAMNMNGKDYALCVTGYDWENFTVMMNGDMTEFINDVLTYDMRSYFISLVGSAGFATAWGFGGNGTWYWDDEAKEGKVAVWFGRMGMFTYRIHCYE